MRLDELFAGPMIMGENDQTHGEVLRKTGFWGSQGAGCIIMARSTGRFLIAHRSGSVQEPNTWGTWGGAIDSGEDPAEAVKREVHEETGFDGPVEVEPLYVFRKESFAYFNFLVIVEEEFSPSLNWENQGSKWCSYGHWPLPLHFGLKGLLADPASAQTMQQAVAHAVSDLRTR